MNSCTKRMYRLCQADYGVYGTCWMIWLQIDVFRKSQSILLNVYIQVLFSWSMHVYQLLHKQDRGFVKKIMDFMALAERISSNCQICLQNLRIYYSMWCTQVLVSWLMHGYQLLHKQDRGFVRKIMEFMAHAERISCNWMWFYTIS